MFASFIRVSKKLETTQLCVSCWVDKQNVLSMKGMPWEEQAIDLMSSTTWMNVKSVRLSERQPWKSTFFVMYVPDRKWQNYRDRNQVRNARGLGMGLTTKGHEEILGGGGNLLCLNCGYSYKTVDLCLIHQTVSFRGMNFIVYKLYLRKHDFKKYIGQPKPTIFQMGKLVPDEEMTCSSRCELRIQVSRPPVLRQKWAGTLASCLRPQHIVARPGVLIPSSQCGIMGNFSKLDLYCTALQAVDLQFGESN